MASVMAIRDRDGNIIDIPVIQGPPGKAGERGPTGVYVGTGEMPEDCFVQIDPDGDVTDFVVSNIVTADGTAPVSGSAVAAYVEQKIAAITDYSEVVF